MRRERANSPHLPEPRERLDQPQRYALEAAGEKRDSGRDQEHADRLLDPAELFLDRARSAHERADRRGGGDEGQAEADTVDGEEPRALGDRISASGDSEDGRENWTDAGRPAERERHAHRIGA